MDKTDSEVLRDVNNKLDFMIDGLTRTTVVKSALGIPIQKRILGRDMYNQWLKNKEAVKVIPNEPSTGKDLT